MRARLLLVIVALITASSAEAYEQWQWKVSGWSEIFTTKSGAVSFMRGLSDKHAYLTIEMTADSPTDDAWAYYKYVAPKVGPIPTSNFRYFDGVHPVSEGATTSEEAFAAAVEAYLAEFYQGSQCPMPTFTPNGTWEVVSDYWGVSTRERKKYRERAWSWNGIECITNSDFDRYVYRDRSANCPYPYSGDTVAPGCLINTSASIQGRPLSTARGRTPTATMMPSAGLAASCGNDECRKKCLRVYDEALQRNAKDYLGSLGECKLSIRKSGLKTTDCIIGETILCDFSDRIPRDCKRYARQLMIELAKDGAA